MRTSSGIGALVAAALVSGTASATQVVVGESRLVIDVEFWGRERITSPNPEGGNNDVITFGDPVHGSFRIFADAAPPPRPPAGYVDAGGQTYGEESPGRLPTGAAFVTSRWLSPLPDDFTHQVSPFPGSVADDFVTVGDRVRIRAPLPGSEGITDVLRVSDKFRENTVNERFYESLMISVASPLDFIEGNGLEQEFELSDLQETEGGSAFGFFRTIIGDTVQFFDFAVDRVRVSPRVCKA